MKRELAIAALPFHFCACAALERLPGAPKPRPEPERVDTLEQVEDVRTDRVLVPTRALRALIQSERELREQLDAIKRVDLDRAAKGAHP